MAPLYGGAVPGMSPVDEENCNKRGNLLTSSSGSEEETNMVPATGADGAAIVLAILLFGPFEARLNGEPFPRLHSRKASWLLALLALRHGAEVERDWLQATLW